MTINSTWHRRVAEGKLRMSETQLGSEWPEPEPDCSAWDFPSGVRHRREEETPELDFNSPHELQQGSYGDDDWQ
jgi:hypothetical protein